MEGNERTLVGVAIALLAGITTALLTGCGTAPDAPPSPEGPSVRVGTYDSRAVALAYGRSTRPDGMLTEVAGLRRDHAKATEAGDDPRAASLEARAVALQDRIHGQVFGEDPIDEIVDRLAEELPAIAAAAGLTTIVDVRRPGDVAQGERPVEYVDVTEALCAHFAPDAETRRLIADLRRKSPPPDPRRATER